MDFDQHDYALTLAALAGTYADIQTTKEALKRGAIEGNPLIGKNPSGQDLDKAGLLGAGVVGSAALFSPENERKAILGGLAGLRFGLANQNAHTSAKSGRKSDLELMRQPLISAALGALTGYMMSGDSKLSISASQDSKKNVNLLLGYKTDF